VNVVVVQRPPATWKKGKYVTMLISSYVPQNGDDGFTFTNQTQASTTSNGSSRTDSQTGHLISAAFCETITGRSIFATPLEVIRMSQLEQSFLAQIIAVSSVGAALPSLATRCGSWTCDAST